MAVRIVRLGSARSPGEGLRIGTVRRTPRGVPKTEYAKRDYYDVWLPALAPSLELMTAYRSAPGDAAWFTFERHYLAGMKHSDAAHLLGLLAAMSQQTDFAVGCYCEDEARAATVRYCASCWPSAAPRSPHNPTSGIPATPARRARPRARSRSMR